LRDEGFDGPVVLVSREPGIPFGRPPLSKTYLRSEEDLEEWYIEPGDWYAAHDVDLRTDSVVAVNPAAHTVALESGQESVIWPTGNGSRVTSPWSAWGSIPTCPPSRVHRWRWTTGFWSTSSAAVTGTPSTRRRAQPSCP
jgi:hypothetical protein